MASRQRDGRLRPTVNWVIHPDDLPMYTQGYTCMVCHQQQKRVMPKQCWVCGFQIKDRQLEMLSSSRHPDGMREGEWDGDRSEREMDEDFGNRCDESKWKRDGTARVFIG